MHLMYFSCDKVNYSISQNHKNTSSSLSVPGLKTEICVCIMYPMCIQLAYWISLLLLMITHATDCNDPGSHGCHFCAEFRYMLNFFSRADFAVFKRVKLQFIWQIKIEYGYCGNKNDNHDSSCNSSSW